jgi:hypothetical protein
VLKVLINGRPGKGFSALDALASDGRGYSRSAAPLSQWVALLAMKYGRAPLPVSRGLEKAFMRQDVADDPAELGELPAAIYSLATRRCCWPNREGAQPPFRTLNLRSS